MSEEKTRTGIATTCIVCGTEFTSASGRKRYCSSRCWNRLNRRDRRVPRVTKTCPVCGKTFEGTPGRKTFCSDRCCHAANRAARVAYSDLYNAAVRERLETDSEAYDRHRARQRLANRKYYELHHPGCKPYRPAESRRLPDWTVKGEDVFCKGSVYLTGNMSDDQVAAAKAYARKLLHVKGTNRPLVKTIFRSR